MKRAINPLLIASILVVLVLIIGSVIFTVIRANTPTYLMLAASYAENVHNNTVNITSTFTLTDVEDAQGNISGNAHVGSPLVGSGPFKGSVGTDKSMQFTITLNDNAGVSQSISLELCKLMVLSVVPILSLVRVKQGCGN